MNKSLFWFIPRELGTKHGFLLADLIIAGATLEAYANILLHAPGIKNLQYFYCNGLIAK